jgi:hypothetical protein
VKATACNCLALFSFSLSKLTKRANLGLIVVTKRSRSRYGLERKHPPDIEHCRTLL